VLIGMNLIRETVETVILTGRLKNHAPVSLLLVASPESGKTSIVLEKECSAVIAMSDVTGRGLQELCKMKPDVTHIIINDLVAVNSHRPSVNHYTMSMINAMTEEGIMATAFPGQIETFKHGKRGIIASIPTTMSKDGRAWWNKIGLSSRMLPVAFKHSENLKMKIRAVIVNGHTKSSKKKSDPETFLIPSNELDVVIPANFARQIEAFSIVVADSFKEEGYRRLKQFLALAAAHALRRSWKNRIVKQEDVDFLARLLPYISYTTPKEI
jgi:hypothetical protein